MIQRIKDMDSSKFFDFVCVYWDSNNKGDLTLKQFCEGLKDYQESVSRSETTGADSKVNLTVSLKAVPVAEKTCGVSR